MSDIGFLQDWPHDKLAEKAIKDFKQLLSDPQNVKGAEDTYMIIVGDAKKDAQLGQVATCC